MNRNDGAVGDARKRGEALHSVENREWLDDALCDAYMAARHGSYDGQSAAEHLERLIERIRRTPPGEQR